MRRDQFANYTSSMDRKDKKLLKKLYSFLQCKKCGKKDFYINEKKHSIHCIKCNTFIIEEDDLIRQMITNKDKPYLAGVII
jgi:hypothetical protein